MQPINQSPKNRIGKKKVQKNIRLKKVNSKLKKNLFKQTKVILDKMY